MLISKKNKKLSRKSRQAAIDVIGTQLPVDALITLHEFAEFLADKHPPAENIVVEMVSIPRPSEEGVIPAIKRLAQTYPMLDKKILFDQTSAAMSAHVLNEVSSKESIDRLEEVFRKEYEDYVSRKAPDNK